MKIGSIVIHCHDFDRTVAFWQAALHYVPREPAKDGWVVLRDPEDKGPNLSFQVTIVEMALRLVHREDEDVSAAIKDIVEREGVDVRLNAECISLVRRGDDIVAKVDCTDGAPEVAGSHRLLAVGRRPNTDDLDLDKAGVRCDELRSEYVALPAMSIRGRGEGRRERAMPLWKTSPRRCGLGWRCGGWQVALRSADAGPWRKKMQSAEPFT
jgi:hypothetical protein